MTARARYHVKAWADWSTDDPTFDAHYATEAEARDAATSRPEPLVDLIDLQARAVIAARRLLPYPGSVSVTFDSLTRSRLAPAPLREDANR